MARILCDMDGVLADCLSPWLAYNNYWFGGNHQPHHITNWDLHLFYPKATKAEILAALNQPRFFYHLKPLPGAVEGFSRLLETGHEVVIVTNCINGWGASDKRDWLAKHFPAFNLRHFVIAERKELIPGDVLIDDGAHNLEAWQAAHPKGKAICMDAPYNKQWPHNRASDWESLISGLALLEII